MRRPIMLLGLMVAGCGEEQIAEPVPEPKVEWTSGLALAAFNAAFDPIWQHGYRVGTHPCREGGDVIITGTGFEWRHCKAQNWTIDGVASDGGGNVSGIATFSTVRLSERCPFSFISADGRRIEIEICGTFATRPDPGS